MARKLLDFLCVAIVMCVAGWFWFAYQKSNIEITLEGVDVSHYTGQVVWADAAKSDINFVYAKATEGSTNVDPQFKINQTDAIAAGIPFGAFHYFSDTSDATKQAAHFVSVAGVERGSLRPVLDLEVVGSGFTPQDWQTVAKTWLDYVEDITGCRPIVYASTSFYNDNLGDALVDYDLWLASYADQPNLPHAVNDWLYWQYADNQPMQGTTGNVDLDKFNGTARALQRQTCK